MQECIISRVDIKNNFGKYFIYKITFWINSLCLFHDESTSDYCCSCYLELIINWFAIIIIELNLITLRAVCKYKGISFQHEIVERNYFSNSFINWKSTIYFEIV